MSKKTFLERYFQNLFRHLRIYSNKARDIIKSNLILVSIVNNIFIIKKLYIVDVNKNKSDVHKKDMLKLIF